LFTLIPRQTKMKDRRMKILVTTPSGKIGSRIVAELLAPEFSVRVIAREPQRLAKDIREQVEVIRGSTDDAATLRRALDGVESLFWCVPAESLQETKVEQHYERFACAAWQAIRDTGTSRVVTISAGGKGRARQAGRIGGLHAMEEILNESGAAIRHLRCGFLMENFLSQLRSICERGLFSYPIPGDVVIPIIAATDVADAALWRLVRRDWNGIEGVAIHGAKALSFNQAAGVMEQILERPVRYQEASANQYIAAVVEGGASAEYARGQVEMFSELARGVTEAQRSAAEFTTQMPLADWAEKELRPAVDSFRLPLEARPDITALQNGRHNFKKVEYEYEI
jgi:uncharacterized protein YbjT (DUF2867 family)